MLFTTPVATNHLQLRISCIQQHVKSLGVWCGLEEHDTLDYIRLNTSTQSSLAWNILLHVCMLHVDATVRQVDPTMLGGSNILGVLFCFVLFL